MLSITPAFLKKNPPIFLKHYLQAPDLKFKSKKACGFFFSLSKFLTHVRTGGGVPPSHPPLYVISLFHSILHHCIELSSHLEEDKSFLY